MRREGTTDAAAQTQWSFSGHQEVYVAIFCYTLLSFIALLSVAESSIRFFSTDHPEALDLSAEPDDDVITDDTSDPDDTRTAMELFLLEELDLKNDQLEGLHRSLCDAQRALQAIADDHMARPIDNAQEWQQHNTLLTSTNDALVARLTEMEAAVQRLEPFEALFLEQRARDGDRVHKSMQTEEYFAEAPSSLDLSLLAAAPPQGYLLNDDVLFRDVADAAVQTDDVIDVVSAEVQVKREVVHVDVQVDRDVTHVDVQATNDVAHVDVQATNDVAHMDVQATNDVADMDVQTDVHVAETAAAETQTEHADVYASHWSLFLI